jgi:hypothetical protein
MREVRFRLSMKQSGNLQLELLRVDVRLRLSMEPPRSSKLEILRVHARGALEKLIRGNHGGAPDCHRCHAGPDAPEKTTESGIYVLGLRLRCLVFRVESLGVRVEGRGVYIEG